MNSEFRENLPRALRGCQGPGSSCQSLKESHVPSWAGSWLLYSELPQCFETLLVTASRRYSALPRDGKSHPHSSTGSRSHCIKFLEADAQRLWPTWLPHRCWAPVKIHGNSDHRHPHRPCPVCATRPRLPHSALGGGTAPCSSSVWVILCCHGPGLNVHVEIWLLCSSHTWPG